MTELLQRSRIERAQANEELFITRVRSQQIRHIIAAPLLRLRIVV